MYQRFASEIQSPALAKPLVCASLVTSPLPHPVDTLAADCCVFMSSFLYCYSRPVPPTYIFGLAFKYSSATCFSSQWYVRCSPDPRSSSLWDCPRRACPHLLCPLPVFTLGLYLLCDTCSVPCSGTFRARGVCCYNLLSSEYSPLFSWSRCEHFSRALTSGITKLT